MQTGPSHLLDWTFIVAILTVIATVAVKWLVPALHALKSNSGHRKEEKYEEDFRELRLTLSKIADSQATMISLLESWTKLLERLNVVIEKMEERGRGGDKAIAAVDEIHRSLQEHRDTVEGIIIRQKPRRGRG